MNSFHKMKILQYNGIITYEIFSFHFDTKQMYNIVTSHNFKNIISFRCLLKEYIL